MKGFLRFIITTTVVGVSFSESLWAVSLDDCIGTALKDNPDAQAAARRVESARAAIREAESAYYPQLTLSGIYTRTDNPPQAFMMELNQHILNMRDPTFDPNNPDDTENLRTSIGAKIRVLDGGQRGLSRDMANLGTDALKAQEEAIRNELVYQVTRGYYGVLQGQAFVKVQEETVTSLEENLRVANERLKAGTVVQTDVLNLEVKLAQAREDLIRARNGTQLMIAALNTAIGQNLVPQGPLAEKEKKDFDPPPSSQSEEAMVENRPELKAARLNTRIRESAWNKSKRDYFPTLSAFGSMDWDSDVSSDFERSYFAGAMAEWEFFTGFRRGAAVDASKANYEVARAEERKVRDHLQLDLTQANLQLKESWERLDVARRSVAAAEESLRITHDRYEQGAADITELLTAQVGLTATRTRNVTAYYDYLTAQANLSRAKGELVKRSALTTNNGPLTKNEEPP